MDRVAEAPHDVAMLDAALARRIAERDVAAWETIFDQYAPWAYRFAYHHLNGNHADAEDLCSDILMTAARSIKHFDPRRGDLDAWIRGLARHRLSRFCRQRRREFLLVPAPDAEDENPEVPLSDPLTEASHQRDLINRALASLPPRQAHVLIRKYVSGYSVEEMAGQL
ncbi:MAG: RNA polymerase sigma factor, partial [Proteobacteria bacterium]|nr:RNA polymerase sigma factor [Pseudomonadota bacterium]